MATNRNPKPDDPVLVNFRVKRHLIDRFRSVVESEERSVSQDLRRYMAERADSHEAELEREAA